MSRLLFGHLQKQKQGRQERSGTDGPERTRLGRMSVWGLESVGSCSASSVRVWPAGVPVGASFVLTSEPLLTSDIVDLKLT